MIACGPFTFYLLWVEIIYGSEAADLAREILSALLPGAEQKPALPA